MKRTSKPPFAFDTFRLVHPLDEFNRVLDWNDLVALPVGVFDSLVALTSL